MGRVRQAAAEAISYSRNRTCKVEIYMLTIHALVKIELRVYFCEIVILERK